MAEMLISGLELLLSVVAARCIRKRRISWSRWVGVLVVALGLVLVRLANRKSDKEEKGRHAWMGDVLIVGQCVMSVIQDMSRGCVEINMYAIEQTQSRERGAPEI